jgi:hypothetical protein
MPCHALLIGLVTTRVVLSTGLKRAPKTLLRPVIDDEF